MSRRTSSRLWAGFGPAVLAAAGMFAATPAALAGAGVITTAVVPLSTNVTYSTEGARPLTTYIGYTVAVGNGGGNTINNIRFTATAAVTDTAEKATFSSADGATCTTTSADLTSIECTIGQLTAGKAAPTFAVFFKVPVKVVNGVADGVGADAITLSGITYYAEGTGGPGSVPQNSKVYWDTTSAPVVLGTFNPLQVKSSVQKSGGNFFTGDGISTADDKFTTSVNVPAAPTYTALAEILESELSIAQGCVNFTPCFQSEITIPGEFQYLTIVLRQDKSTIKAGVKVGNVLINYVGADWPLGLTLGACPNPTTPLSDRPCIAASKYYKNKAVAGWTPALDGDFEWTIITSKNGGYKVQ